MPSYDFRCKRCLEAFSRSYRTYKQYEAATPTCPQCGSADLSRLITQVAIPRASREYGKMSANEMLSVLESGDQRQAREMFKQVGGSDKVRGDAASDESRDS